MKIIESDQLIVVDVDQTIILWPTPDELATAKISELITFIDPYDGVTRQVLAHRPNIKILKDRYVRGCTILVWSQSGYAWAAEAVRATNLQDYVAYVASKPFMALDDVPASEWLQTTWLKPDNPWAK